MSKGTRASGKNNPQSKVPHPGQESGKMSDDATNPLTTDTLVSELDKLRRNMTGELKALLNSSLESIHSSIASIGSTLATQATTITDMETSLSDHSDRITHLEQEVSTLQSKLMLATEENVALRANVEDLVSRSERQNIRVAGLPEDSEGKDVRQFMTDLFTEVVGDALPAPLELDRAHWSLRPKPHQGQNYRPIIVRFHRYIEKEAVLKWVRDFIRKNITDFEVLKLNPNLENIIKVQTGISGGVSRFYNLLLEKVNTDTEKIKLDWEEEMGFNIHENTWEECLRNIHTCSVNARHNLIQFKVIHMLHYSKSKNLNFKNFKTS
ncbi:hypothetical protein DPX16_0553 [Anabarilius grahami]|uniref:LINE-1 type transposase domain-containing protein 1 n=1 Tax=Anabarilius grahami TaxID=495550 RepID=A0A3N0XWA1_ANAGA|nr:hypothetical protein DPX16_0553 [Anabarilius grahami]